MPPRKQPQHFLMNFAACAAPPYFNGNRRIRWNVSETEVHIRTSLAGVAIAAVHLRRENPAIGQHRSDRGAHGRSSESPRSMARPSGCLGTRFNLQKKMQADESACAGTLIVKEVGWFPLVGKHVVKAAIAVHISDRDSAANMALRDPDFTRHV